MGNELTPKQALEELKFQVGNITYFTKDLQATTRKVRDSGLFEIIDQALTEHEKQKQILEVLKKCFWELDLINEARDYKQYSGWFEVRCGTPTLTKTEFNLIKEWLK